MFFLNSFVLIIIKIRWQNQNKLDKFKDQNYFDRLKEE